MQRYRIKMAVFVLAVSVLFQNGIIVYGTEIEAEQEESTELQEEGRQALRELASGKAILALVYLTDIYDVRERPDKDSSIVISVQSGQSVQILDAEASPDGNIWYRTGFYLNDNYYQGYIEREFLASSDEEFLKWENDSIPGSEEEWVRAAGNRDIESFPGSYQPALRALKNSHPNWTFVKMNTNLDWDTVIRMNWEKKVLYILHAMMRGKATSIAPVGIMPMRIY